jgi:hypothetical protein
VPLVGGYQPLAEWFLKRICAVPLRQQRGLSFAHSDNDVV